MFRPLFLARVFFVILVTACGYWIASGTNQSANTAVLSMILGLMVVLFEYSLRTVSTKHLVLSALGLIFGLVVSGMVYQTIPDTVLEPTEAHMVTNLFFAWLATVGYSIPALFVTIGADNFSNGFASVTLIAWLSSLVDQRYTATQYALLSSLMTLPGKFIGGFSGFVVDAHGYVAFFLYVAALGLPAIALCSWFLFTGGGKPPEPDRRGDQGPGPRR